MIQAIGTLTVNLSAISQNWLMMQRALEGRAECAAVVKANAYGLGVARVAQALYAVGCRTFFVARLDEAIELRHLLPERIPIYVLQGAVAGEEILFIEHRLIPVLVSMPMVRRWQALSVRHDRAPCAIKINTGMNRLGLSLDEYRALMLEASVLQLDLVMLASHLACADEPDHPLNRLQLERFGQAVTFTRERFPGVIASLANSAGVFLGPQWQQDLVRTGIALYGGRPRLDRLVQPSAVVTVTARVIQTHTLQAGEAVGYGADFRAEREMTICTVSGGYAEGLMRSLNNCFKAWFHQPLPLLGRVSMDSLVFDVSHLEGAQRPVEGDEIELLGEHVNLDDFARCAGTSSYEVLTGLGGRLKRRYLEPGL